MSTFSFLSADNVFVNLNSGHDPSIKSIMYILSSITQGCGQITGVGDLDMLIFDILPGDVIDQKTFSADPQSETKINEYEITLNKPIKPVKLYSLNKDSRAIIGELITMLSEWTPPNSKISYYIHFTCFVNRESIRANGLINIPGKQILNSTLSEWPFNKYIYTIPTGNKIDIKALQHAVPPQIRSPGGSAAGGSAAGGSAAGGSAAGAPPAPLPPSVTEPNTGSPLGGGKRKSRKRKSRKRKSRKKE